MKVLLIIWKLYTHFQLHIPVGKKTMCKPGFEDLLGNNNLWAGKDQQCDDSEMIYKYSADLHNSVVLYINFFRVLVTMSSQSICCKLCFKTFTTYQKLLIHERNRHLYNKTIPHFYSLPQPSSEQMFYYINSFIVLIKKKLGFSRHAVGKKRFSIDTFPENVFVYLFKNEEKFKYSPARHKYQCSFEGSVGAARLKEIFHYDHWSFRQDPFTNTKGYVLLENYENTYQVKFSWSQMTLLENNREFMLGRMTCNFITDSGEFQENNEEQILTSNNKQKIPEKPVEGKFHYILPRPPLNIINQHSKFSSNPTAHGSSTKK